MPKMMPEGTLEVLWMLPGGGAGGRLAKGTFTVRGAYPGDHILPEQTHPRGRTLEVKRFHFVQKQRSEHPCPVLDTCGGCDLGGMQARQQALCRMVEQGARMAPVWVSSPRSLHHRARMRLGVAGTDLGFHGARSTHLVPIERCFAAREELQPAFDALAAVLPLEGLKGIELRTDGTRVVTCLDGVRRAPDLPNLAVDGRRVHGDVQLQLLVGGLQLQVSPRSFFQANLEVNELLVAAVVEAVVGSEHVLDLCAGVGNFSVPIAAAGRPVTAVEIEGQATKDLIANAARHSLPISVHKGAVERFDPSRTAFDAVVLDPPRAGCKGVVDKLLLQRPRTIVYVSCHLPSAMRDLKPALSQGYSIESVTVFDMFPDTHHVETLLILRR